MKNKKNLIIIISVIVIVVIGLAIYFVSANKENTDATKDVVAEEVIETEDEETPTDSEPESGDADKSETAKDDKDEKKSDTEKSDDKKDKDKKSDDKKSDSKKDKDKKSDDKKDDKSGNDEKLELPEPDPIPEAKNVEQQQSNVVDAPAPKEEEKYGDAKVYTNKNGQLAAKTDDGTEVELTGDNMQKIYDELAKERGTGSAREKELLDQLKLIMDRHEVMELEEK